MQQKIRQKWVQGDDDLPPLNFVGKFLIYMSKIDKMANNILASPFSQKTLLAPLSKCLDLPITIKFLYITNYLIVCYQIVLYKRFCTLTSLLPIDSSSVIQIILNNNKNLLKTNQFLIFGLESTSNKIIRKVIFCNWFYEITWFRPINFCKPGYFVHYVFMHNYPPLAECING